MRESQALGTPSPKTLLKRHKYPPDRQEEATETVLKQAESLSAAWVGT
jgi:type I restriction enzyme R subunit